MLLIILLLLFALQCLHAHAREPNATLSATDIATLAHETEDSKKTAWCEAQTASCGTLCNGNAPNNTCDTTTTLWNCTCAYNNSTPAMKYYAMSIISFECNDLLAKCLAAHANDRVSQNACQSNYVCGNGTYNDMRAAAADAVISHSTSTVTSSTSQTATATAGNDSSFTNTKQAAASATLASSSPTPGETVNNDTGGGGLNSAGKVGIGVGVGLGVPLFAGLVFGLIYVRRLLAVAAYRGNGIRHGDLRPEDAVDERHWGPMSIFPSNMTRFEPTLVSERPGRV